MRRQGICPSRAPAYQSSRPSRPSSPLRRGRQAPVAAAGQIGHRQGGDPPQGLQQARPGPRPGDGQEGAVRQGDRGREGGPEGPLRPGWRPGRPRTPPPAAPAPPEPGLGAAVVVVGKVQQEEEIQPALGAEHVVAAADGVAAVDQHQLPHAVPAALLQHRLGVAAEVVVGQRLGVGEGVSLPVEKAGWPPRAASSSTGVYLQVYPIICIPPAAPERPGAG